MKRCLILVAVGVVGALALPGRGSTLEGVSLVLPPMALANPPSVLAAWTLQVWAGDGLAPYVALERRFQNGRAQELHSLLVAGSSRVTFDGERGSFEAEFAPALRVSMAIAPSRSAGPVVMCGGQARVPVALHGSFVLRTGTKFFRTIRRSAASGSLYFNSAPPLECTPPPPVTVSSCVPGASLEVSRPGPAWVSLSTMPWNRPWSLSTMLGFGPRSPEEVMSPSPVWTHFMRAFANPFPGSLPKLAAHMPAWSPIQGGGTFTAQQTSEQNENGCHTVRTTGAFEGSFRTRFTGWGIRTLRLGSTDTASYTVRTLTTDAAPG